MTHDPSAPRPTLRPPFGHARWLGAFALLAACSGQAVAPSLEVSLDTSSVALVRGASAEIQVTLTRLGSARDPIALSVATLPDDVIATFAPATLNGATLTSTLTIAVAPGAAEAATDLSVVATSGTLTDDAALTLTITSLTVVGRVEGLLRRPLTGIPVTSQGQTDFTDPSGSFTLAGLSLPYDLVVTVANGSAGLHAYEGMTSPSPLVRPHFGGNAFPTLGGGTTVTGTVLGGPIGVDEAVIVCLEGLVVAVYGCDTVVAPDAGFSIGVTWFEGATVATRLHAFHFEEDDDGLPLAYLGYEAIALDLSNGVAAVADLDFGAVGSDELTGSFTHPAGVAGTGLLVWARFGPNLSMPLVYVDDPLAAFDVLVPVVPGLRYDVMIASSVSDVAVSTWTVDVGLDAGHLDLTEPARHVAPSNGVSDVDLTTSFTTTAAGGARTYVWDPVGTGPYFALTTTRTTVTLPDPASGGLALPFPAGLTYQWGVAGHGEADVDTAAAGGFTDFINLTYAYNGGGGPGLDGDRTVSLPAATRDLTFAP